jgi:hypothetical protein
MDPEPETPVREVADAYAEIIAGTHHGQVHAS